MKPVLFVDFYGTLSDGVFWHTLSKPHRERIEQLLFNDEARDGITDAWMRGKKSSEEINRLVSEHITVPYDLVWDAFIKSVQTLGVFEEELELVRRLNEKYETVLITDNMDAFSRFAVPEYQLDNVFNKIINSADVGIRKHDGDGEIFKLATKRLEGAILIDDSKNVCDLFEEMGGTAFHVCNAQSTRTHLSSLLTGASK